MVLKEEHLTKKIIRAFYSVYNDLGYGYLENVYEEALLIELQNMGYKASSQVPMKVAYKGQVVGDFFADVVVENKVILELKAAESIHKNHVAQLMNYLRASNLEVGLVLNFGPNPEFKRRVYDNQNKHFAY